MKYVMYVGKWYIMHSQTIFIIFSGHTAVKTWWLRKTVSLRVRVEAAGIGAILKVRAMAQLSLWLCQNSYGKSPFIVDFPIKNGDFP